MKLGLCMYVIVLKMELLSCDFTAHEVVVLYHV